MNQRQASFSSGESSMRQISGFRVEIPERTVLIFVGALLPSAIRIGKADVTMQPFHDPAPVGERSSVVTGNGLNQLGRKGEKHGNNGGFSCPALRSGILTAIQKCVLRSARVVKQGLALARAAL